MEQLSLKEVEKIEDDLNLKTPEVIEETIRFYVRLFNNEEYLRQKIEKYANIIIGVTVIVMAIITGFFCIMLYDLTKITLSFLTLLSIIYTFIVIFIYRSIEKAIQCIKLERVTVKDLIYEKYRLTDDALSKIKKFRAINFYLLFIKNKEVNDKKKECLVSAQDSLKCIVIVLVFLFGALILDTIASGKINVKYCTKVLEMMR